MGDLVPSRKLEHVSHFHDLRVDRVHSLNDVQDHYRRHAERNRDDWRRQANAKPDDAEQRPDQTRNGKAKNDRRIDESAHERISRGDNSDNERNDERHAEPQEDPTKSDTDLLDRQAAEDDALNWIEAVSEFDELDRVLQEYRDQALIRA